MLFFDGIKFKVFSRQKISRILLDDLNYYYWDLLSYKIRQNRNCDFIVVVEDMIVW